jgi:hypothetical protein
MKRSALLSLLVSTLALSACGSGMTINADWNDTVDFSTWSTFRYAEKDELNPADALQTNPFAGQRVRAAIERNLQAKGYTLVETGDVDFVVLAHAGIKEKMSVTNWGASYGGYYGGWYDPWWGPYGGNTTVSYYDEGTLVIDMVDMSDKELSWRGMATATLESNPSADKMEKNINKAVDNILMRFPPQ